MREREIQDEAVGPNLSVPAGELNELLPNTVGVVGCSEVREALAAVA